MNVLLLIFNNSRIEPLFFKIFIYSFLIFSLFILQAVQRCASKVLHADPLVRPTGQSDTSPRWRSEDDGWDLHDHNFSSLLPPHHRDRPGGRGYHIGMSSVPEERCDQCLFTLPLWAQCHRQDRCLKTIYHLRFWRMSRLMSVLHCVLSAMQICVKPFM